MQQPTPIEAKSCLAHLITAIPNTSLLPVITITRMANLILIASIQIAAVGPTGILVYHNTDNIQQFYNLKTSFNC